MQDDLTNVFWDRWEQAPDYMRDLLQAIAVSIIEPFTTREHESLIQVSMSIASSHGEDDQAEFGWLLERMSSREVCQRVIGRP